ncbi:MAG: hypothetical protein IT159_02095 [Bryobacterales bacterium]|nr:hypothetical protein [Bryobacterales bacterium]
MRRWVACLGLLAAAACPAANRDFLTAAEIDQLREIQEPDARLQLYAGFVKARMALLQQLTAKDKAGRSAQIREALEEYTSLIDAMDAVTDDALRRRQPLDAGIKAVVATETEMLAALRKISDSEPKDLVVYKFLLEQAIMATEDSLEMARTDLNTRSAEVISREAKEKRDREAAMRPEEVESRRAAEKKEAEQKRKVPTLRRPGEQAKEKP